MKMNKYSSHITPRDLHFDFSQLSSTWLGSPYLTHMFNAPSITTPYMEGLVNYAVMQSIPHIKDESLKNDCKNFIKQETFHAREHVKYNQQLKIIGYDAPQVLRELKAKLSHIKNNWPLLSILAIGVSFESLTTHISQTAIEDNILGKADPAMSAFWNWHMQEELEHKSVLFNLYSHMGGRYFRRARIHTLVLFYYCYYSLRIYLRLLKKDGASRLKGLLFVSGRKSFFRKSLLAALAFFWPGYHPDKITAHHLIKLDTPQGEKHGQS